MKKIIVLLTALVFSLTLGTAFAQDPATPAATSEKNVEKAPVKKKAAAKKKKKAAVKKQEAATPEAAPASN